MGKASGRDLDLTDHTTNPMIDDITLHTDLSGLVYDNQEDNKPINKRRSNQVSPLENVTPNYKEEGDQ
jgi:hypothetical protein